MSYKIVLNRYPRCWGKVRGVLYRVTAGRCERCGRYVSPRKFTIHHVGAPYADGRPGDSRDKHDIRRENLAMLCEQCHCSLEPFRSVMKKKEKKRASKRSLHAALHVGTGLVIV
jgi:hypothetical protein